MVEAASCWPTVLSVLRAATTSSTDRLGPLTTSSSSSCSDSTNVHYAAAVELQLPLVHLIAVQLVFAWRRSSSSSSWSTLASKYDDDDDDNNPGQADIAGGRPIQVVASRGSSCPDTAAMAGECWPPGNAKVGERLDNDDDDGTDTGDDEDWHDDDVIGFADAIVVALIKDLLDCERDEREDRYYFVRSTFFSTL